MAKDYYSILGVSKTADDKEIKKAYRKLAHQYHPDKKGGDEAKFKEINEAYQTLSDPAKRQQYNQFGSNYQQAGGGGGFQGGGQSFSFEDIFGQGGFSFGGNGGGFEDIFSDVFGGRSGKNQNSVGRDIQLEVEISLEEAFSGVSRTVDLNINDTCEVCEGTGAKDKKTKQCPTCHGQGYVDKQVRTMLGVFSQRETCTTCQGRGKVPETVCNACHGSGIKQKKKSISINIPAGIADGQTLEMSGKGEAAPYGGRPGNIYIHIKVKPHKIFKRQKDDIYLTQDIPYTMAVFGGDIDIPTLSGEVQLTIPKHTQSGEIFRLRSKGMPGLQYRGQGDLFVTIRISTPKHIPPKAKQLLKDLQKLGM
jgi:molecular chaperone DnaJ